MEQNYKIPNEREKCAFLYDDTVPFAEIMKFAESLRKDYNVAIIKKAKKPGPQYDMLEKQGYTKFASVRDGQVLVK